MKLLQYMMMLLLVTNQVNICANNSQTYQEDHIIRRANQKMSRCIWPVIQASLLIGIGSWIGTVIVDSFAATKNIEHKNEIILATCIGLYGSCLGLAMYEEYLESLNNKKIDTADCN